MADSNSSSEQQQPPQATVNDSPESAHRSRFDSLYHDALDTPGSPEKLPGLAETPAETEGGQPALGGEQADADSKETHTQVHHAVTDLNGKRMSVENPSDIVVESLHAQIADLSSQVTSLNAKLVKSFGRIGDLEEEVDKTTSTNKLLNNRVKDLDSERQQWEERIEHGLLVEKVHVQTELTRMMDRVMEETAHRGKAEDEKKKFESELDELSAQLFNEANLMVALERKAKLTAEEKSASLEARLRDAESALSSQAKQMNVIGNMLEDVEKERDELKHVVTTIRQEPAAVQVTGPSPSKNGNDDGSVRAVAKATFPGGEAMRLNLSSVSFNGVPSGPPSPSLFGQPAPFSLSHPLPPLTLDILPFIEFRLFVRHLTRLRASTLATPYEAGYAIAHQSYAGAHVSTLPQSQAPSPRPNLGNNGPALSRQSSFSGSSYHNVLLSPLLNPSVHSAQPFVKRCQEEDTDQNLRLDLAPGLNWLSRRNVMTAIIEGHLAIEPLFGNLPSSTCALCGFAVEASEPDATSPNTDTSASSRTQAMRKLFDKSGSWAASTYRQVSGGATAPAEKGPDTRKPNRDVHIFHTDQPGQITQRYTLCTHYCLPRMRASCELWGFLRRVCKAIIMEEAQKRYNPLGPGTPALLTPRISDSLLTPKLSDEKDPFFVAPSSTSRAASPERMSPSKESESALSLSPGKESTVLFNSNDGDETKETKAVSPKVESATETVENTTTVKDTHSMAASPTPTDQEAKGESAEVKEGAETKEESKVEAAETKADVEKSPIAPETAEIKATDKTSADPTPEGSPQVEPLHQNPFELRPPVPKRSNQRGGTTPKLGQLALPPTGPVATAPQPGSPEKVSRPNFSSRTLPAPASPALRPSASTRQNSSAGVNLNHQQSWEHKTWLEIVKLKERMFWAKVGAVNAVV